MEIVARPLADRVALVTGAGRRIGIGAAIAARLRADGARVLLHSWSPHDADQPWGADPDGPDAVFHALGGPGPDLDHVQLDLADPDSPAELVGRTIDRVGALDLLVINCARSSSQDLAALTAAELNLSWAVNTRAPLLLTQAYVARHDDHRSPAPDEIAEVVAWLVGPHSQPITGQVLNAEAGFRRYLERIPGDDA